VDGGSEPATGVTRYGEAVLRAAGAPAARPRLCLPPGTPWSDARPWQAKGYAVVRGVTAADDPRVEAKRLLCSHALIDKEAVPL
jgi:ATP phosphoribosyltransferase regulatory subunit